MLGGGSIETNISETCRKLTNATVAPVLGVADHSKHNSQHLTPSLTLFR